MLTLGTAGRKLWLVQKVLLETDSLRLLQGKRSRTFHEGANTNDKVQVCQACAAVVRILSTAIPLISNSITPDMRGVEE